MAAKEILEFYICIKKTHEKESYYERNNVNALFSSRKYSGFSTLLLDTKHKIFEFNKLNTTNTEINNYSENLRHNSSRDILCIIDIKLS